MSQTRRQTKSEAESETEPEKVIVVRKPKQLPDDIRCGICRGKFGSCEACSEHMKTHYWDRLDSPRQLRTATMATGFAPGPPSSPPPQPPSASTHVTPLQLTSTPRPQTAQDAVVESRRGGNSPSRAEYAGDIRRSKSEPFSNRRRGKKQTPGGGGGGYRDSEAAFVKPACSSPRSTPPRKVHVCFECQGEFDDALSLTRHSQVHGAAKPYSCTRCGRTYALYSSLMNHERTHSPGRGPEFKCNCCSASFLHEASLKAHQRKHGDERTGSRLNRPYQCNTCDEWLSNEGSLKIHMQRHEGFDTPWVCSLCGTSFSCGSFLRAHSKLHEGESITRCVICVRPFRRSRVVLRHSDVHAEDRRDVCLSCEKRFPKVGDGTWRRMQLLLPEQRRFQCLYCGASFPRLNQLAAHEMGHTDPLPPAPSSSSAFRMRQPQQQVYFPTVTVN